MELNTEHAQTQSQRNNADPATLRPIGEAQVMEAIKTLERYKTGKKNLEDKIIDGEEFWKLRHWDHVADKRLQDTPATPWLWNVIISKHADMMDGYPAPNILPREEGDKQEAGALSSIVPVVLEQNEFQRTYSDCCLYKLKHGAAIYMIVWDKHKLNGLGDITIRRVDALNLFWEPGITDLQNSRHLFHCELVDNEVLLETYPELSEQMLSDDRYVAKYMYDDSVDTTTKSTVIDWYYKRRSSGREILHYCKFVGTTVLYATENETQAPTAQFADPGTGQTMAQPIGTAPAESGLYDHAKYPFVIDCLYAIEGSPFGYGFTDVLKETQISLDQLNKAKVKHALMGSKTRYFVSDQCNMNPQEFSDWEKETVRVTGMLDEDHIREIQVSPLPAVYIEAENSLITMLKETSGTRDVNNGGGQSGVTAASAIAALQEAGNKSSRDIIATTYDAYRQICTFVIELIRQFYDTPRQFRILGERGAQKFVNYDNRGIRPQPQGADPSGEDMGYRVPQFDIKVSAQKATPYSKLAQNELALQFYNQGFFVPENADQALACLDMMDFDGKEDVIQRVQQNGTLLQTVQQLLQTALGMAQAYDPQMVPVLMEQAQAAGMQMQPPAAEAGAPSLTETDSMGEMLPKEPAIIRKAREQAQNSTQPR